MSMSRKRRTLEARKVLGLEMQGRYYAGATIRGLAAEYGCSYGAVRLLLLLVNTQLRKRGGGIPGPIHVTGQDTRGGRG